MGVFNAIVRAAKYLATGEDTVIREQMEEIIGHTQDSDLRRQWHNVQIEYGANRIDPSSLNDKMKAIYMQCTTVYQSEEGSAQEHNRAWTNTQRQMGRITTSHREEE